MNKNIVQMQYRIIEGQINIGKNSNEKPLLNKVPETSK